ncbi:hypothetical protein B0W81_03385 [Prochlorococcus sp. HOT_208_60]|nr:hypothetical protein B0W81_03385 [Prochlorococcus sp. HOT_208_60]
MKEEIDWKKELLESKKFNNKFSNNILENGVMNYMQDIYMGYMYSRWKKIRSLDLHDHEKVISRPFPDHQKEDYGVT